MKNSNISKPTEVSANAAGAQSVYVDREGRLDQRTGYVEGNSTSTIRDGSNNLVLGSGASYQTTYLEQLSDDVVARALDSVDSATGNAFDFGRDAFDVADRAYARTGAQLQGAITLADDVARRSAEYADASRVSLERLADPAGSASRVVLYVVAGLAALALLLWPRKSPKSAA